MDVSAGAIRGRREPGRVVKVVSQAPPPPLSGFPSPKPSLSLRRLFYGIFPKIRRVWFEFRVLPICQFYEREEE